MHAGLLSCALRCPSWAYVVSRHERCRSLTDWSFSFSHIRGVFLALDFLCLALFLFVVGRRDRQMFSQRTTDSPDVGRGPAATIHKKFSCLRYHVTFAGCYPSETSDLCSLFAVLTVGDIGILASCQADGESGPSIQFFFFHIFLSSRLLLVCYSVGFIYFASA